MALTIGGLLVAPVFIALHALFRDREAEFSMAALGLGVAGAFGATIHGAYDVATLAHPFVGGDALRRARSTHAAFSPSPSPEPARTVRMAGAA